MNSHFSARGALRSLRFPFNVEENDRLNWENKFIKWFNTFLKVLQSKLTFLEPFNEGKIYFSRSKHSPKLQSHNALRVDLSCNLVPSNDSATLETRVSIGPLRTVVRLIESNFHLMLVNGQRGLWYFANNPVKCVRWFVQNNLNRCNMQRNVPF